MSEDYVTELDREQGRAMFDRVARRRLGISGDEFLRQHAAGQLDYTRNAVLDVEILMPFAR